MKIQPITNAQPITTSQQSFKGKITEHIIRGKTFNREYYKIPVKKENKILEFLEKICPEEGWSEEFYRLTKETGEKLLSIIGKNLRPKLDIPEGDFYTISLNFVKQDDNIISRWLRFRCENNVDYRTVIDVRWTGKISPTEKPFDHSCKPTWGSTAKTLSLPKALKQK